jgi:phage shock protein A
MIAATISWFRSERAIDSAKEAMAEVKSQNTDIEGYRESVEVTKNRVGKLRLEVDQLEERIDER